MGTLLSLQIPEELIMNTVGAVGKVLKDVGQTNVQGDCQNLAGAQSSDTSAFITALRSVSRPVLPMTINYL